MNTHWPTALTESPNLEINGKGRIITGTYGKQYIMNSDGEEIKVSDLTPKVIRGRGRPKKDTSNIMSFDPSFLSVMNNWSK